MGSQVKKVLLQGVWGSLTGGWYYNPRHSKFTNIFHLYTWLVLMILPFIFYMVPMAIPSWASICSYSAAILAIFISIKVTNYRLHTTFDKGEVVKREVRPCAVDPSPIARAHAEHAGQEPTLVEQDFGPVAMEETAGDDLQRRTDENNREDVAIAAAGGNGRDDNNLSRQLAVGDVEVDVHAAPVDLFQVEGNNNKDNTLAVAKRTKRRRVRARGRERSETEPTRKPRHRQRTRKKAVAFAENSRNVGRCVSLPSASSDSEDETDSYQSRTSSDDDNSSDSMGVAKRDVSSLQVKSVTLPHRRRAIRGARHHPWSENAGKATADRRKIKRKRELSDSSGTDEDWAKADSHYTELDLKAKRKGDTVVKDAVSTSATVDKEKTTVPTEQNAEESVRDSSTIGATQIQKATVETEKDNPSSDQELLTRDPVLGAQRSFRYASDRLLFFQRRSSYTVNSLRQVAPERRGRRGMSTVPPYGGRRAGSSPGRGPSSLKRLLSLWHRDSSPQSEGPVPGSPGQVSPGEVRLTGISVDDSELPVISPDSANGGKGLGGSNELEGSSRNSNPHFSETHTPERKAEELGKSGSGPGGSRKVKKKKADRERLSVGLVRSERPGTPVPGDEYLRDGGRELGKGRWRESGSDTDEFINKLIGDSAAWQGNAVSPDVNILDVIDGIDGGGERPRVVKRASAVWMHDDALDRPPLPPLIGMSCRPHPVTSNANQIYGARSQLYPRTGDARPLPRTRSRRVRHPAGESRSRITSNTSEDSGSVTSMKPIPVPGSSGVALTTLDCNNPDDMPPQIVRKLKETEDNTSAHIAVEHDDTSVGATHAFQDEHGNWLTYTFGESTGTAQMISSNNPTVNRSRRRRRTLSSTQAVNSSDEAKSPPSASDSRSRRRFEFPSLRSFSGARMHRGMDLPAFFESDVSGSLNHDWQDMSPIDLMLDHVAPPRRRPTTPKVKLSYKFKLLPFKSIVLQYDRLSLLDLLDRNRYLFENWLSTLLAILVAVLGLVLLQKGFFYDVWPLWFCVVIATAQYSLISSVQPDSASPTHGFNRVIAYSRPIYFCVVALLILLFDYLGNGSVRIPNTYVYAGLYFTKASCLVARNVLLVFIMSLPFVFLLGLLPQINTFAMYLAEQTEIHMFGGSASNSLQSAAFSLLRSTVFSLSIFGFCYGGMKTEEGSQHLLYSVFCGLLVSVSYHLSRQTNDPVHIWRIICAKLFSGKTEDDSEVGDAENGVVTPRVEDSPDQISTRYVHETLSQRLQSDIVICPLLAIFAFAIHCSTAFTVLQSVLSIVLYVIAGTIGFTLHYLMPQLRKHLPWLLFSKPILKAREYALFEITEAASVMWFEKAFIWLTFTERNFIYPLVIMNQLTTDAGNVVGLYGLGWGTVILTFVGMKLMRSSYGVTSMHYAALAFSALYITYDSQNSGDSILITYFLATILFVKFQDMMLKLQFVFVYIAPWQITWGSTFHAFAQPVSVPHSGMLLINTVISSLFHAPLAPFLGSAIFVSSYMRPLKFWEKNYNTKRVDHSNTRLASQIDRGPSSDDNNLNSIFYEHLTLSLQKSLCGDIAIGRWGCVYPGDCFIMTSDYLNALVHIIQKGNGVIAFQVRGLEFSGTYCQQREVEAIVETFENRKCCCCSPGHPRNMLSFNMAMQMRWLAWQIQTTNFVLDGYSISDISATSMLGVYDLRKVLLSYMVKSVLYFLITHKSLETWLHNEGIEAAMNTCEVAEYVDVDTSFSVTIHDDYDLCLSGISRAMFKSVYGAWIRHCVSKRDQALGNDDESKLVTLSFMVSVLCRRALGTASVNLTASHVAMESFMYGLHSLFKGDFRITSQKDEWIFSDMDLLHNVVVPGVRMAIKLHQDHFQNMDEDEQNWNLLYDRIATNAEGMVITHEGDPEWRRAVLANRESLLALRHVAGEAVDTYFVVTLRKRSQGFRVVRVNKECVKGLWAGQQQELVFLRNSNPERGSIQNAKQVLRNMINSSCDQPIGYPIYVSPVTTSFSNTHPSYREITGRPMSLQGVGNALVNCWNWILQSCGAGCNSGGSAGIHFGNEQAGRTSVVPQPTQVTVPPVSESRQSVVTGSSGSSVSQVVGSDYSDQFSSSRVPKSRSLVSETIERGRFARANSEEMPEHMSTSRLWSKHGMPPYGTREMPAIRFYSARSSGNTRREGSEDSLRRDGTRKSSRPSVTSEDAGAMGALSASALGEERRKRQKGSIGSLSTITRAESASTSSAVSSSVKAPHKSSGAVEGDASTSGRLSSQSQRVRKHRSRQSKRTPDEAEREYAKIVDVSRVLGTLEIRRATDRVKWPNDEWRKYGGRSKWEDWNPENGAVGEVVFRWFPNHRDPNLRSHIGEVILLLRMKSPGGKAPFYVPIPEKCTEPHKPEIETTQL